MEPGVCFRKYEAFIACHEAGRFSVVVKQIDNVLFSKKTSKAGVLKFLHIVNMKGISALKCKIG